MTRRLIGVSAASEDSLPETIWRRLFVDIQQIVALATLSAFVGWPPG